VSIGCSAHWREGEVARGGEGARATAADAAREVGRRLELEDGPGR
jgi:hypothetical protein